MSGMGGGGRAFWGSVLAAAAAVALLAVPLARWIARREPPAGTVRLLDTGEVWLLAVFTGGALGVLLGLAAVLGGRLRAREPSGRTATGGAGWWTVALGGALLAIYLVGWIWTTR